MPNSGKWIILLRWAGEKFDQYYDEVFEKKKKLSRPPDKQKFEGVGKIKSNICCSKCIKHQFGKTCQSLVVENVTPYNLVKESLVYVAHKNCDCLLRATIKSVNEDGSFLVSYDNNCIECVPRSMIKKILRKWECEDNADEKHACLTKSENIKIHEKQDHSHAIKINGDKISEGEKKYHVIHKFIRKNIQQENFVKVDLNTKIKMNDKVCAVKENINQFNNCDDEKGIKVELKEMEKENINQFNNCDDEKGIKVELKEMEIITPTQIKNYQVKGIMKKKQKIITV